MTTGTDKAAAPAASGKGPRISVITANYNYAHMLGDTMRSVLAQTYDDVEYIVVDDGSTDNSLEIARSFEGVTVIAKPNGGQMSADKIAIEHVTGDVVIFLDSDDRLYPEACTRVAAAYSSEVTLYQSGLDVVDLQGKVIGSYPDAPLITAHQADWTLRHGFFPASPASGNAFAASHVRRMLDAVGEDLRFSVDGYLIFSAPFFGSVKRVEGKWGSYTVHGNNQSLSAGVTNRSVERTLRDALLQRSGVNKALAMTGRPAGQPVDYLTAWHLRHLLILRRCYGVRDIVPELSDSQIALRAIGKFLRYPGISVKQRIQNAMLIGSLLVGYKGLGAKVVPAAA